MKIKVIFDKDALDKNLRCGWGVSFLLDNQILFDTGEKGEWLLSNMHLLEVDINKIEAVVISHDHWDHWGGLWDLLQNKKNLPVYICPNFSREFKDKANEFGVNLIEAGGLMQISPGIFSTGEIPGVYHGNYMAEQAVLLKTKKGLTIITGCAHPGILKIIEQAENKFSGEPIYFVLGGFHLIESDKREIEIIAGKFKQRGIVKAAPTHCSGKDAQDIFKKHYADNFVSIKAGQEIEV